jgi:hypothetical protein
MNHMFVGLYIQQLCLCALFFLAQNEKSQPSATYEGAFMIVLIVFTVSIVQRQYSTTLTHDPGIRSRYHSQLLRPSHQGPTPDPR